MHTSTMAHVTADTQISTHVNPVGPVAVLQVSDNADTTAIFIPGDRLSEMIAKLQRIQGELVAHQARELPTEEGSGQR